MKHLKTRNYFSIHFLDTKTMANIGNFVGCDLNFWKQVAGKSCAFSVTNL